MEPLPPFELHPVTLRFGDRELEDGYLAAWNRAALWPMRIAGISVLLALLLARYLSTGLPGVTWWRGLPAGLMLLLGLGLTYLPRARPYLRSLVFLVAIYGAVGFVVNVLGSPIDPRTSPVEIWITFTVGASVVLQLGFVRTLVIVAAYGTGLEIVMRMMHVDPEQHFVQSMAFGATTTFCVIAAYVSERRDRHLFFEQRQLVRERARSEQLLKREVSHQVAERSRELGNLLAKSDVTLDVRRLSPNERFANRYRIVAALGAGGMGAVYEVERVTDGERLALKVVVGEVSGASAARFAREAEIGARVHHPHLVSIVDVGVASGVPFLAMELVPGGSLEGARARYGDVAWALPILRQIAEGLAALHDAGIVHRDLKPANVLLAASGAKISDFGISRLGASSSDASIDPSGDTMDARPTPRSNELTGTGVVMGTPLYMAPEGARGGRTLDASADVFALGIIAHELLTGRAPFAAPAFVLAMAAQPIPACPPIDDPRVPAVLDALVRDALSMDPARRPPARAFATAIAG